MLLTNALIAQDAKKMELFNLQNIYGDTIRAIPIKGIDKGFVQIVFSSLNCDTAKIKIGYSLVDTLINYPATISGLSQPITLNKNAIDANDPHDKLFTHTVKNRTTSSLGIFIPQWQPYYMLFKLTNACETGKIYLIYK
jgi:hypothetical protein